MGKYSNWSERTEEQQKRGVENENKVSRKKEPVRLLSMIG